MNTISLSQAIAILDAHFDLENVTVRNKYGSRKVNSNMATKYMIHKNQLKSDIIHMQVSNFNKENFISHNNYGLKLVVENNFILYTMIKFVKI